ncbi:unnamed protein product [Caenorhabditis auriculariae]|uniref:Uncharacterized protein n=1 Tax=Caenorhabditis auriculariae TaxID=2777116 RepID=A0A8S1H2W1_9PELO|nr:unnamed protein product [Caenorhabditis auriculariae]
MALPRLRVNANSEERLVHPNHMVYQKMEGLVQHMLDPENGVPIKTVKSFLSKVPSVFTGQDLISWIMKNLDMSDLSDALHLAHLVASHGYLFQIDDHVLTVKNDGTFYRFQTPYFWPSNCWEPENTDYAVYLCKRTMQNKAHLELEDFEAENLAKLQKMFSRKWEFVFMQAEAQYKVDKKRDRLERQILDSQERAFWDVHRPVPGCVNTTEVDFRKLSRSGRPKYSSGGHAALNAAASSGCGPFSTSAAAAAAHAHATQPSTSNGSTAGGASPSTAPAASSSSASPGQSSPLTSSTGGASSGSGSFRNNYYARPGLRRCTQVQDTLKLEHLVYSNAIRMNGSSLHALTWPRIGIRDEKKFNLDGPDGYAHYWRDLRKDPSTSKRNFGGGSLMVWAAFCGNRDDYQQLLAQHLLPYLRRRRRANMIYQQDNASVHASNSTLAWFAAKNVVLLDWPACSPDLNPVENLWSVLVRRVYANAKQYTTVNDLKKSDSCRVGWFTERSARDERAQRKQTIFQITNFVFQINLLNNRLSKNVLRTSKVVENYLSYYEQRRVFDPFLTPPGCAADQFQSQPNPWINDTVDFWQHDKITGDISTRRLKLWEECFEELLADPLGRETLQKFLDKEYSGENLRFWWEVQKLRKCSSRMVPVLVTEIYNEFIDTNAATSPVNVDCKVMEITEENLKNPNRWSFDEAADHIYCLMKNDSYQRFLRSDIYKDLVAQSRKKHVYLTNRTQGVASDRRRRVVVVGVVVAEGPDAVAVLLLVLPAARPAATVVVVGRPTVNQKGPKSFLTGNLPSFSTAVRTNLHVGGGGVAAAGGSGSSGSSSQPGTSYSPTSNAPS